MTDRDDLIRKLRDEINRCKAARLDSRKEYDDERLSLSALNSRLADYDKRIADATAELNALLAESEPAEPNVTTDSAEAIPVKYRSKAQGVRERYGRTIWVRL